MGCTNDVKTVLAITVAFPDFFLLIRPITLTGLSPRLESKTVDVKLCLSRDFITKSGCLILLFGSVSVLREMR